MRDAIYGRPMQVIKGKISRIA